MCKMTLREAKKLVKEKYPKAVIQFLGSDYVVTQDRGRGIYAKPLGGRSATPDDAWKLAAKSVTSE